MKNAIILLLVGITFWVGYFCSRYGTRNLTLLGASTYPAPYNINTKLAPSISMPFSIEELQQCLIDGDCNVGNDGADGELGPNTISAIIKSDRLREQEICNDYARKCFKDMNMWREK